METTNAQRAIASAVAYLNQGAEDFTDERAVCLDDWFGGKGADDFVTNLASAHGDRVAFVEHDDPQSALEGFGVVSATDNWQAETKTVNGLHFLAMWTKGGYIDSCLLFVFGVQHPLAVPMNVIGLTYSGGPLVYLSVPRDQLQQVQA